MKIHVPEAWNSVDMSDLMACEAGQAYVLDQLDPDSRAIKPSHTFNSSRENSDAARYLVFDDGSMWFQNNASDEVWADFRDFVTDELVPGITAQPGHPKLYWSDEDAALFSDDEAWVLDDMDRGLLLHYTQQDEKSARELIALEN